LWQNPGGRVGCEDFNTMPWAVIGLVGVAIVAIAAWPLTRRLRQESATRAAAKPTWVAGGAPGHASAAATPARAQGAAPSADASVARSPEAARGETPAETLTSADVQRRLNELALATAPLASAPPAELQAMRDAQRPTLESVATEPRYAPRRPLLLPHLLRAVNDDDASRQELSRIIARDPALTGSLLNLANSAFYRVTERPVESIDRAVALLGTDGLRSLVATALTQPVFRLSEKQFSRFPEIAWAHTYRSAAAAEAHAAIVEDDDPFAGQLLGLTFGLGTIVTFRVALDYYAARSSLRPEPGVIAGFLDAEAPSVAHRIAGSWDLSGRILNALADQIPGGELREPTPLGRSLQFGRLIGALAVLESHQRVSEASAKATLLASGATAFQFERLWGRLTGRQDARTSRVEPRRR
jgi:HD-like signal output (HDOD) protein